MTTILFKWKNYCFRAKVRVNRCPVTSELKTAEELGRVRCIEHVSEALLKWLLQQQTKSRSERSVPVSPVFSVFKWISVVLETFVGIFARCLVYYSF